MSIGAFGENFPYSNFHDLNLDWIIKTLKGVDQKLDEAIENSSIKFADPILWDSSRAYQKNMVAVYENIGYMAKKDVPAGIAITDTEYWEPIFDMTSIMEALDGLEQELDDDMTAVNGDITALQEAVGTNTGNITALQNRTGTLENTTVKNNSTKHLLYLGDSYSTYWNNQLYNEVANGIGIPVAQCHNVAVSGAAFVDQNNSFLSQAQNYTGNKSQITDILVVGGINDALAEYDNYSNVYPNTSALQAAIRSFVSYCNTNYPNARIHFAYVGGTLPTSSMYSVHPAKSQEWAFWAYTVFAMSLGVNVLDTYNAIHMSPNNYYDDGIHPNSQYGVTAIAQDICASFNGKQTAHNRPTILVSITASGISASGTLAGFARVVNNIAELSIPDQYVYITAGQTIGNTEKEIASLADSGFIVRNPMYVPTTVTLSGFGLESATQAPAMLIFRDGKVYIKVYIPGVSDWQTLTAAGASSISFAGIGDLHLPLWQVN